MLVVCWCWGRTSGNHPRQTWNFRTTPDTTYACLMTAYVIIWCPFAIWWDEKGESGSLSGSQTKEAQSHLHLNVPASAANIDLVTESRSCSSCKCTKVWKSLGVLIARMCILYITAPQFSNSACCPKKLSVLQAFLISVHVANAAQSGEQLTKAKWSTQGHFEPVHIYRNALQPSPSLTSHLIRTWVFDE